MIGQPHGNHILNLVQLRDELDFGIDRIGFNDSHNPAVRQYAMDFDTIKSRNAARYGFGTPFKTTDHNP